MDHGYFKDRISAYHDNNLKPEERVVVEEHLKECEECRKLLAEFEKLDRLVEEHSQLGGEEYWEESARKIEKSLGFEEETKVTEVAPSRRFGLTWKLVAVAASVVILTIVGLHRDEIWHEQEPEKHMMSVPKGEAPADKGADKVTDERQTVTPVQDEDISGPEVQKTVRTEELSGSPRGKMTEETETQEADLREVTPAEPESPDIGKAPSPSKVERSGVESDRGAEKGTVENKLARPVMTDDQTQRASGKEAEEAVLFESDTPEKEAAPESLARLREQKDSLTRLMVAEGRWQDKTDLVQSFTGDESKKKPKRTPADIENELIQTCYKIALLTEDPEEFEAVRDIIEKVAEDKNSPNRELAKSYLQQLSGRD